MDDRRRIANRKKRRCGEGGGRRYRESGRRWRRVQRGQRAERDYVLSFSRSVVACHMLASLGPRKRVGYMAGKSLLSVCAMDDVCLVSDQLRVNDCWFYLQLEMEMIGLDLIELN